MGTVRRCIEGGGPSPRIGDSSEDPVSKFAVAGLIKHVQPIQVVAFRLVTMYCTSRRIEGLTLSLLALSQGGDKMQTAKTCPTSLLGMGHDRSLI